MAEVFQLTPDEFEVQVAQARTITAAFMQNAAMEKLGYTKAQAEVLVKVYEAVLHNQISKKVINSEEQIFYKHFVFFENEIGYAGFQFSGDRNFQFTVSVTSKEETKRLRLIGTARFFLFKNTPSVNVDLDTMARYIFQGEKMNADAIKKVLSSDKMIASFLIPGDEDSFTFYRIYENDNYVVWGLIEKLDVPINHLVVP